MTYNIVLDNVKGTERGSKAAATLVCLPPCKVDALVYNRGTVGITSRGSI